MSENARCTTGLVCPLHVSGVCLKLAIIDYNHKRVMSFFDAPTPDRVRQNIRLSIILISLYERLFRSQLSQEIFINRHHLRTAQH